MDHGRIIAQGSPQNLLSEHFADVVLELPEEDFTADRTHFPMPLIEAQGLVEIATHDVEGAINALLTHGVPLARLKIRPRTLEDLFLELTGRELRA